jgi:hypothetical protein
VEALLPVLVSSKKDTFAQARVPAPHKSELQGYLLYPAKMETAPPPDTANPLLRLLRTDYNRKMDALMQVLGPVLEWMFFIGMAGSALVIVISFIEDFNTIFEED